MEVSPDPTRGIAEMGIAFQEELGAGRLLHGQVGGADFVVQLATGHPATGLERISLTFPPAALHLFDAQSGRRCVGLAGQAEQAVLVAAETV